MPMNSKLIPQHKQHKKPAQGMEFDASNTQDGDNFGVTPFDATHKPHSEPRGGRKRELKDHQRGAGRSIKYHPARMSMQASPDHGDHE